MENQLEIKIMDVVDQMLSEAEKKETPKKRKRNRRVGGKKQVAAEENVPVVVEMFHNNGHLSEEEEKLPDECQGQETITKVRAFPELYRTTFGGPMDLAWFAALKMSKEVQQAMCYSESLLLVTESGDTVGKMYCTVSESEWNGTKCLSVHSGSIGKFQDGLNCGTSITGFVDARCRALHEYIHEWAKIRDQMFERKTFLIQEKEMMHCRVLTILNKQVTEDRVFFLSKIDCLNLITESGNVILQRLIIQQKKSGEIIVRTVTARGEVVRCNYECLGNGKEIIKGESIKVHGIRRTVFEEKGAKEWDSLFNHFGRLVLRCQPDNSNALVPLWFEAANAPELETIYGSRPPLLWACDPELYSKYITRKREKAGDYRTYLNEHPELRALLSDFLQAVLQQKPENVIVFASHYFEPWLSSQDGKSRFELGSSVSDDQDLSTYPSGEGDSEWQGEGGYRRHSTYPVTPIMEDDNVLLEENPDYYLNSLPEESRNN